MLYLDLCFVRFLVSFGIQSKATRRHALVNLFHSCMKHVLGPISHYGEMGIAMVGRDGIWRRCHPILASFVGDYPEQVLVTCTYYGHCPKCLAPWDQLGEHTCFPSRDHNEAIDTYFLAGSLTLWIARTQGQVRTRKESERAKDTHFLNSVDKGTS
jgi:hypothetical protein